MTRLRLKTWLFVCVFGGFCFLMMNSGHWPTRHELLSTSEKEKPSWLKRRKQLLSENEPLKVLLFSYMRGGSSLAGEMFNVNPNAMLWYEPLDAFYSWYYGLQRESLPLDILYGKNMTARMQSDEEKRHLVKYFANLFTCNYRQLPTEGLFHVFLAQSVAMDVYFKCLTNDVAHNVAKVKHDFDACKRPIEVYCEKNAEHSIRNDCHRLLDLADAAMASNRTGCPDTEATDVEPPEGTSPGKLGAFVKHAACLTHLRNTRVDRCLPKLIDSCHSKRIRTAKVVRFKMADVPVMLEEIPDLHVIYFVRDPRAIINSRMKTKTLMWDKTNRKYTREASVLCSRISDDVASLAILQKAYPGAVHFVNYEDLVDDPVAVVDDVYSFLGVRPPAEWIQRSRDIMFSPNGTDGGGFGIKVKDARRVARRWRAEMRRRDLISINKQCSDVIISLGYEL